jgi:hypothetical protein
MYSSDFSFFDQTAVETFASRQVVDQRGEAIGKMHGCDGRPIRNRKGQSFFNQKAFAWHNISTGTTWMGTRSSSLRLCPPASSI